MATIIIPLLVCLVGALVYGLAAGKVAQLGLVAFAVGLFWCVYLTLGRAWHL
jgi:hypothetical protein